MDLSCEPIVLSEGQIAVQASCDIGQSCYSIGYWLAMQPGAARAAGAGRRASARSVALSYGGDYVCGKSIFGARRQNTNYRSELTQVYSCMPAPHRYKTRFFFFIG